jgi:hypothetical protein
MDVVVHCTSGEIFTARDPPCGFGLDIQRALNRFEIGANNCRHAAYFYRRPEFFPGTTLCAQRLTKRLDRYIKTNLVLNLKQSATVFAGE